MFGDGDVSATAVFASWRSGQNPSTLRQGLARKSNHKSAEDMMIATSARVRAATPMIHVPDVRATAAWYEAIGFAVSETYPDGADGSGLAYAFTASLTPIANTGAPPWRMSFAASRTHRHTKRCRVESHVTTPRCRLRALLGTPSGGSFLVAGSDARPTGGKGYV